MLKDDERLKSERAKALKAKERFAQNTTGIGSDSQVCDSRQIENDYFFYQTVSARGVLSHKNDTSFQQKFFLHIPVQCASIMMVELLSPEKPNLHYSHDQGWKPGYLALGCQFRFRCVETQMSGFSFGLVSRLLKIGFSFAYAQLRFLGFGFGLSFIQKSYFVLNTNF